MKNRILILSALVLASTLWGRGRVIPQNLRAGGSESHSSGRGRPIGSSSETYFLCENSKDASTGEETGENYILRCITNGSLGPRYNYKSCTLAEEVKAPKKPVIYELVQTSQKPGKVNYKIDGQAKSSIRIDKSNETAAIKMTAKDGKTKIKFDCSYRPPIAGVPPHHKSEDSEN